MGILFSCCRRRDHSAEREPLLPTHREQQSLPQRVVPSQHTLNHSAAILAALQNGKLPSQQQVNAFIDILLTSSLFNDINTPASGVLSSRGRLLLQDISKVLQAAAELGAEKNDDSALQRAVYELRSVSDRPLSVEPRVEISGPSPLNAAASQLPQDKLPTRERARHDRERFAQSAQTLLVLLFTSSAFRLLLTNVLATFREILADFSSQVGDVAQVVQAGAQAVEGVVRPSKGEQSSPTASEGDDARKPPDFEQIQHEQAEIKVQAEQKILEVVDDGTTRGQEAWESLQNGFPDRMRDTVMERIKTIVRQAQTDPRFQSALNTIIILAQNYYRMALQMAEATTLAVETGLSSAVNDTSVDSSLNLEVDPHLKSALLAIKSLLGRFVDNQVDATVHDVSTVLQDLHNLGESAGSPSILQRLHVYLQHAVADSSWMSTTEADAELGSIYDAARSLYTGDAPQERKLKHDTRDALAGAQAMTEALARDTTLQAFLRAITKLGLDSAYVVSVSKPDLMRVAGRTAQSTAAQIKREIQNDVIAFVVPRLIQAVGIIPLPRIEFKNPKVDAVLENLNISSFSFIPDRVTLTNWSEMNIFGSDAARTRGSYGSSTTIGGFPTPTIKISDAITRTRIRMEGLRISADEIAYYVNAKGPFCFGWQDYGLLTLDVGSKGAAGEGALVDIEIELTGQDFDIPDPSSAFFKVLDVKVDVPGLKFTITKSRHWIFNALFLQPLLGPSVREATSIILAQQIRGILENVGASLAEISRQHAPDQPVGWLDWITSLIHLGRSPLGSSDSESESDTEPSENEQDFQPPAVTSTSVTTKGVVHTSHQPATMPENDTVIAVGIGEQVLRDIPLPSPTEIHPTLVQVQRAALDDLEDGVHHVESQVQEATDTAAEARDLLRQEVQIAGAKWQENGRLERQKRGWRSAAFDIGR